MPVVDLDRISKSYSSKVAVRELSLRIEQGTIFGLLGPNGAGKTSTIRMMVGNDAAGFRDRCGSSTSHFAAIICAAWAICRRSAGSTSG